MARKNQPIELTNFSKGLITEANPLTFPPDASVDELNFNLTRTGTRSRRLGMDYEIDYVLRDLGLDLNTVKSRSKGVFRWENVSEEASLSIAVVQVSNVLYFHDLDQDVLSEQELAPAVTLDKFSVLSEMSFTVVDGNLIVAAGSPEIAIVSYNGTTMDVKYNRLLIRDMFGVADLYSDTDTNNNTIDLRDANNIQFRPEFPTDNHVYNLRNQTFGLPRSPHLENDQSWDPIENFHTGSRETGDKYKKVIPVDSPVKRLELNSGLVLPSNADIVHY
jgi:hypothetical protein